MKINEITKRIISSVVLMPLVILIIIRGSYYFNIFLILCFFISIFEWLRMIKSKFYQILGGLFLIVSFFSIYEMRNISDGEHIFLLFVTSICICTDVGGYLFGKIFKGPKLTKLSPNKTYSGMVGSFLLTLIISFVFVHFFSLGNLYIVTEEIIIFSILISCVSQIGDIIISYFKRVSKIKDTGNIIPGHGGLLDRIDGMIFAFPFSYMFLQITNLSFFT